MAPTRVVVDLGCDEDEDFLIGPDEDNDECVILDGEPNKAATVADEEGNGNSDKVRIVAATGQIACRDYPRSRHSCSKFGFSCTAHVMYCTMCFCYVCDAPAPCKSWGNGTSPHDHCHATDNEAKWKTMRQAIKGLNPGASSTEIPRNDVYPMMASSRQQQQQPMIINAAPQPHWASSVPRRMSQPASSLGNRSHIPQRVSQSHQGYRSLRMSASVVQTVTSRRRYGRGTLYNSQSSFQTSSSSAAAVASQAQTAAAAAPADSTPPPSPPDGITTNSSTAPSPPNAAPPRRGRQPRYSSPPAMPSRKSTRLACNATPSWLIDAPTSRSSSRAAPKSQLKKPRS